MINIEKCPICGRIPKPIDRAVFYECEVKHGVAMFELECRCGIHFQDFTFEEKDYDKRLEIIAEKWSKRYEGSESTADA